MRTFALLATLALLVTTMPVRADPGGGDAPDEWENARDIDVGTHVGTSSYAGPGRWEEDWYRVVHPVGKGVRVTVSGWQASASLHATANADRRFVDSDSLRPIPGDPDNSSASVVAADPAGVRIGLVVGTAGWNYTLRIEVVDVVDVQVSGLEVREEPGRYCYQIPEPCPAAARRFHVSVEVRSVGALPYEGDLVLFADGDVNVLWADAGRVSVRVEPGSVFRVGFTWTPTAAGDFTLLVRADPDANLVNSEASARASWLVSGTPGVVVVL